MVKLFLLWAGILLSVAEPLLADENIFIQYKTKDGLSFNNVDWLAEDDEGLIYACTNLGLNVFDGTEFTVYNQYNTAGFSNKVSVVLPIKKGYLLIGTTDKGLFLFDKYKEKITPFKTTINNTEILLSVSIINKDPQGNIWIGTETGELFCSENTDFFTSTLLNGSITWTKVTQLSGAIDALYSIGDNTFAGDNSEKVTRIKKVADEYIIDFPLKIPNVTKIYAFSTVNNALLIGTDKGLYRLEQLNDLNYNTTIHLDAPWKLKHQIIRSISTHSHNIWIGTEGQGLFKLNLDKPDVPAEQFTYSKNKRNSLNSNYILSSLIDSNDNLWLGTWFGGINMMDLSEASYSFVYDRINENDLFSNITWCMEKRTANSYWIGTHGNGLCTYQLNEKSFSSILKNTVVESISSIHYDKASELLFIGTWGNGVKVYNPASNQHVKSMERKFEVLKDDRIYAIISDHNNRLWIGSYQHGLYHYDSDKNELNHIPLLKNQEYTDIRHLLFDKEKEIIWAGSLQKGLFRVSLNQSGEFTASEQFDKFEKTQEPISIESIYMDRNKALWILTRNGIGIIKDGEKPIHLPHLKGIITTGLTEDRNGNYWISTYNGIHRIDKDLSQIQSFLTEYSFHDIKLDSVSNLILAASDNGLLRINPNSEMKKQKYPEIVLSDLKVFDQLIHPDMLLKGKKLLSRKLNYSDTIVLPYFCHTFSIGVNTLSFSGSQKEKIRFQLENFEATWNVHKGTSASASYTNVPPGSYSFKVQVANDDSLWNPHPRELIIIKQKPWWATNLSFLVYTLILLSLIYVISKIIQTRTKMRQELKIEKIKQEREHELYQQKLHFFTNISHDVRTPLTLIIGPLEEMAQTDDIRQDLKKKIDRMLKNAQMLLRLFNQVLDFRKMETDNLTLNLYQINLNDFAKNVYYQFKELADTKKIDLELSCSEESIMIVTDPQKLESILFNLVSNALKFTPSYGHVLIDINKTNDELFVSIKDTGFGISEEDLKSVFTRFYRTETNNLTQGTGIGLTLVKRYVQFLKGEITVKSIVNKGTEFIIKWPVKTDQAAFELYQTTPNAEYKIHHKTPEYNTLNTEKKETILVIDDNQDIRDYLTEILKTQYGIVTASNGKEGLALSSRKNPDLVICDIMMEGMNGLEVCEQIKTNLNTSHIPVILLTAKNSMDSKIEGFEKGADAYIEKPFNSQLLLTRIKNLIEHRQLLKKKFTLLDSMTSDITPTSVDEKFLQQVIALIEKNITDSDFSVQSLVEGMNVGQDQLYRKIKALTGLSINHFIRSIRLKKAAQLLKAKKFNVSEVVFQVGFNNPSYFTKCFKSEYGMLPSEFINT